ncbi:integrase [Chitinispirillum alkaliphilum]|nr:integrase [Chitinispirillum alkaliphilum]
MNLYRHLALEERYMIYTLRKQGYSIQKISRCLKRSVSTVSREICRNQGHRGYRHKQAQRKAQHRLRNSHKATTISQDTIALVKSYIKLDWSPEQVSNYLKLEFGVSISTERIYQIIWDDKQNNGDLYCHLRQFRRKRRKRYGSGYNYRGTLKNRISIDDRPEIVDTKERIGDWEIDTIIGKQHKGAVVSIVERKSKFTLLAKVEKRDASLVGTGTVNLLKPYEDYVFTITGDNGKEMACHEDISKSLGTTFYFAHPYSSWERGLNENTNGLVRQYIPKGSDLSNITELEMNFVMNRLNTRPRKCLGYRTPKDVFFAGIGFSSPPGERKTMRKDFVNNNCAVALTN